MEPDAIAEPAANAADNSVADNSGVDATPEPSWRDGLSDDLKDDEGLGKFKDVEGLAKSYKELESYRGNSIKIPEKGADSQAMDDIWDKLGRPEAADKYEYEPPAKIPKEQYNQEVEKSFLEQAHTKGFTKDQAHFVLDYYNNMAFDAVADIDNVKSKNIADNTNELKKDWGRAYDQNISIAARAFDQFASDRDREYFANSGLDSDPSLIRLFHKVGAQMTEGKFTGEVKAQGITSPEIAREEVKSIRADTSHPLHAAYHDANDPKHNEAIMEMERLYGVLHQED
jgi:hypothetical protein|tara:strand:- start:2817 stop:3671 length:855 start_codon:yes stop_codon:yes gene_type:complete